MPGPLAEALVQQLNRAETEPIALRLRTAGGLSALHAADRLHAWAQYHQYPILRLCSGTTAPTSFGPVRELLRLLLPSVQRESADLLAEFAPELTMLLPELRARPQYASAAALSAIAPGAAKRRLHGDSQRLSRLVTAVARVAGRGLADLGRAYGRPPVILIEHADLCDRHTLACLLRIWQTAQGPGPVIVLATSPAGADRPRWAARPQWPAGGVDDAVLAGWTDAEGEQDRLLARFLAATAAVDLPGEQPANPAGRLGTPPELASLPAPLADRLVAAAALGDPVLAAAIDGPLDGPLSALVLVPDARRAILRQLTNDQYKAACRALADRLRTTYVGPYPDGSCPEGTDLGREGVEAALAFLEVAGGEHTAGARRALRLVEQSFGFTLNHELILLCCRIALAAGESAADRQPALLYAGLTHAYLGHSETAAEIFDAAYTAAAAPELRAQISYYQGLIAAKRCGRLDEGRVWFERGLVQVAGQGAAAARLESGWLRNGLALVAWRQGRRSEAEDLVRSALADTEGSEYTEDGWDIQAVNLRVNLIDNLSVLQEAEGDHAAALDTWRLLEPLSKAGTGGSFTKPYLYRESWLLLQLGEVKQAYNSAAGALEVACRHRDLFHMQHIGGTCIYLACRLTEFADAERWAQANLDLARELGDSRAHAHAAGQLAHVFYQSGNKRSARQWMERAAEIAGEGPPGKVYRVAHSCMSDSRGPISHGPISRGLVSLNPNGELYGIALDQPKPRLPAPAAPAADLVDPDRYPAAPHGGKTGPAPTA